MKKIISLSAVLILLLQVFVCPADAKTYDSESAKNLLVGLGIMGKYDFEDDEEISRADFAGLAVRTMNKLEEASGVVGDKFGDVSMEDDHAAEIYYLDSLDVMIGDDSGNFNPYEPLLMKDAVKAVVTMLNYGAQAKSSGGYPLGYMNVASEIGLTKGMNKNRDAVLTAKEAVILLANALNTEMLQQVFEGGKISFKTIEGETLLYKAFDCIKGEGRVSANDKTTLEIPKRSSEGTVVIDDFTFDRGTTDIDEKLGYYVEYYAFEPEGTGDWVIAAYEILENKNEILELAAVDITEETTENEIVYEYGSRVKSAKIAPAADVIYNGFAIQGAEKWQLMPDSGNVTLFDTDSDNTYDIVIIESYINYVLDKAVQGDYIIDKYSQPAIDLDEDNWEEISARLSGKEIDLSELKEWDVLSVKVDAEKLDANGYREIDFDKAQYIEISVSRKEISGRADSVDRAEGIITIGFDEYRISQNLLKAELDAQNGFKLPDGGEALSVVLDINGNAAAIKTSGFTQMQYGFLVKTIVDTEDEPVAVYLKIYTGEQGIVTFKCKEKFRFNGENGLNTVWADELINKPQLVSFRTNTEGLICDIDTGVLNTSYENKDNSLVLGKSYSQARHKSVSRVFASGTYDLPEFYISGTVQIYKVPSKTNILNNNYSEDDFEIISVDYFEDNKRYDIDTYNVSEAMLPEIMVVYVDNSISTAVSSGAKRIMIDTIYLALDEYDEETVYISGYYRGDKVEYSFKKMDLVNQYIDSNGNLTLKRGDTILVDANDRNEITAMSVEYSFSENLADKHVYGGGIESKPTHFGTAYSKNSSALVMKLDADKAALESDMFSVFPISATKNITLYDSVTNTVSVINPADVLCERDVGSDAYLLLVQLGQDGQAKDIIAYKMN